MIPHVDAPRKTPFATAIFILMKGVYNILAQPPAKIFVKAPKTENSITRAATAQAQLILIHVKKQA